MENFKETPFPQREGECILVTLCSHKSYSENLENKRVWMRKRTFSFNFLGVDKRTVEFCGTGTLNPEKRHLTTPEVIASYLSCYDISFPSSLVMSSLHKSRGAVPIPRYCRPYSMVLATMWDPLLTVWWQALLLAGTRSSEDNLGIIIGTSDSWWQGDRSSWGCEYRDCYSSIKSRWFEGVSGEREGLSLGWLIYNDDDGGRDIGWGGTVL